MLFDAAHYTHGHSAFSLFLPAPSLWGQVWLPSPLALLWPKAFPQGSLHLLFLAAHTVLALQCLASHLSHTKATWDHFSLSFQSSCLKGIATFWAVWALLKNCCLGALVYQWPVTVLPKHSTSKKELIAQFRVLSSLHSIIILFIRTYGQHLALTKAIFVTLRYFFLLWKCLLCIPLLLKGCVSSCSKLGGSVRTASWLTPFFKLSMKVWWSGTLGYKCSDTWRSARDPVFSEECQNKMFATVENPKQKVQDSFSSQWAVQGDQCC